MTVRQLVTVILASAVLHPMSLQPKLLHVFAYHLLWRFTPDPCTCCYLLRLKLTMISQIPLLVLNTHSHSYSQTVSPASSFTRLDKTNRRNVRAAESNIRPSYILLIASLIALIVEIFVQCP